MKLAVQIQYDANVEYALWCAAQAGYRYISMGFGNSDCFQQKGWEKHVARMERLLKDNGLQCVQTHFPCYDLRVSSEILDEAMENAQMRCVIAAGMLGAQWNVYHCRTAVNFNYSPRISIQHTKHSLEKLLVCAEKNRTGIAIENIPLFPELYWMRFLGSDVEDLCQICDDFKSDALSICWDFGHAHLMKHDEVKLIQTAGNRIQATHIHDNYQMVDDHTPPGMGTINWPEVMDALMRTGYNGFLTQELVYPSDKRLESFMAHSFACGQYLYQKKQRL